jgi:multicomponent Na+:H+ antiporter subunit F
MTVTDLALYGVMPILALAMMLAFVRLLRGPSLPDRVVAVDLLTALSIGVIATYAIATEQTALLDVAIVLALVSFLGTVAFAYYIERTV